VSCSDGIIWPCSWFITRRSPRVGHAPDKLLRGSPEFHAWGDSNLYLRRSEGELTLTIEHRAAPSLPGMTLELAQRAEALGLEVRPSAATSTPPPSSVDERITAALMSANGALPIAQLRAICRVRNATLHERLTALTQSGRLVRGAEGYRLAPL
jgi:hypothetical protein